MSTRKRGAQPNNTNAVSHGRFSRATRQARREAWERQCAATREWMLKMPKTDYGAEFSALPKGYDGVVEMLRKVKSS